MDRVQRFGPRDGREGASSSGSDLLQLRNLSKRYGATRALRGVDLNFQAGEIHALIGQNGAGKSTLIKILAGYTAPDAGTIAIRGEKLSLPISPRAAQEHGLSFLHQDLSLVHELSVMENIRVGQYRTGVGGRIRWGAERAETARWLRSMGLEHLSPDTPVRDLSQAERALIALIRALQHMDRERGGILVLDEPTAYLPGSEVERLFQILRDVSSSGIAVIFVSHRLDEVLSISHRISVLRDGDLVGTVRCDEVTERDLIAMILGRDLGAMYPTLHEVNPERALSVSGLRGRIVRDIAFNVARGEILGLTGLLGMGHDEVPYLLFGAKRPEAGLIETKSIAIPAPLMTPARARTLNMAFLPADRQHEGGVPGATLLENVTMPEVGRYFRRGRIEHRRERSDAAAALLQFEVRPPEPDRLLSTLSGGNQQKTVLGKWLRLRPDVLLLHEPTQGVDLGSRKQIFRFLHEIAGMGASVIIASSEHEDLANVCHRVLIFRSGHVVQDLAGANLTVERVVEQCYASQ